jgi:hypothetical protein
MKVRIVEANRATARSKNASENPKLPTFQPMPKSEPSDIAATASLKRVIWCEVLLELTPIGQRFVERFIEGNMQAAEARIPER